MIVTKRALARRTFLRGAGAAIALPFLDAMVPPLSAAPKPTPKLAFYYVPNGMSMNYWRVKGGSDFELSPILKPFAPVKDQMILLEGLGNYSAVPGGGGNHTRVHAAWLSGVAPKRTEGADVEVGVTADQIAARAIGRDTPLMSLELAVEPNFIVGNCDNGYSCVYANTFSWRGPTTPNPMETNPRAVFERLFGDGGSVAARIAEARLDRSILDAVTDDISRLRSRLAPYDRRMVDSYLDAVRDVERRIQRSEQQTSESRIALGEKPVGVPDSFEDHATLLMDLQLLAFQAEVTRVSTLQMSREQTNRAYPHLGVPEAHHDISHHQNNPERLLKQAKINTHHAQMFSDFVGKMRNTPDGDGSLLDHAVLLYGSGMGDGDLHSPLDLPLVIMGGGCGQLKGNRHLTFPIETPMPNLLLAMLEKVGVREEHLGDSNGVLSGL